MHDSRHASGAQRDRWILVLTLAVTVVAAFGHFRLPLDVENAAMKAEGTPAARAAAERDRTFGRSSTLLAMLEPRGKSVSGAPGDPDVADWLCGLPRIAGVRRSELLPASGPAATLVALEVEGPSEGVVEALRAGAPPTHRLSVTGASVGEHAIAHALAHEQSRVVPLILGAFALLFLAIYRRPSLVVATLLSGLGSILWLGGLQKVMGLAIHPVSALLAPVVLTVGVAAGVHLIERHLALVADGLDPRAAPAAAIRSLARPLVLATLTTVAGFLALVPSSIPAVRSFGWLAALGVLLALAWSVFVVPSWLRLSAGHLVLPPLARDAERRLSRARRGVAWLRRAAPWVVGLALVASTLLGWLGREARVDTDPGRILPAQDRFRRETDRIAERLGGIESFELLLPASTPSPGLPALQRMAQEIGAEPLVRSLAGAPRRAPDGTLLASVLLAPGGTSEREALFARVEACAERNGFRGARVTGGAVQVAQDSGALVHDMRASLVSILALLWLVMSVGLRSWRLGLLGLVPNVVPCAVLHGTLRLVDRPLSVATAMIATVLLGLIVDDTIHLLHAYAAERRAGHPRGEAVARALARSGHAIVVTSVVLAVGFGAGLAGELATTVEFALLSALTILLALACNAILLPAMLVLPERFARAGAADEPSRSRSPSGRSPLPCPETTTSSS